MMGLNRKFLILFLALFIQTFSLFAQFAPEKMKGGLFVENKGQWENNVLYKADIPSGQLYIEKNRFLFNFYDAEAMSGHHANGKREAHQNTERSAGGGQPIQANLIKAHAYEVAFLGCSPISSTSGVNPQNYAYNYFKGDDPGKWASNVQAFSKTILKDIYPNTSLVCLGQETGFKYEFHLAAGANPYVIQMKYDGVDTVYLKNGELFIETSVTDFYEQKPYAYQEINGVRSTVPCQFKLINNVLSFVFPKGYNKHYSLVIDPQLIFSTYSKSTADNWGNSATYDDDGNTYMVGIAFDLGYPVTTGAYQIVYNGSQEYFKDPASVSDYYGKTDPDIAIMKFDPSGKILYATYLGGTEAEVPSSCIVNSKKELVLFGFTGSDGLRDNKIKFPTTADAYDITFNGGIAVAPFGIWDGIFFDRGSDLFIATLSENGNALTHSTLVGGSNNDGMTYLGDPLTRNYGDQFRGEIYCDEFDDVYIVTKTFSADIINTSVPGYDQTFNGSAGTVDAYVCKFSSTLSTMYWNTFLGGTNDDVGYSIRVPADKSVYITGGTTSSDFPGTSTGLNPTYRGNIDGFIAHLSADGASLIASTYIGTSSYDQSFFIQLDAAENIYILGQTFGDFPISPGAYGKASTTQFIQKIDPALTSVLLSTTFGSHTNAINIVPTAFLVNNCDNILIAGWGGNVNYTPIEHYPTNLYIGGNTNGMDVSPNALFPNTDGSDFYLLVLEKQFNSLLYSTYYGGIGEDDHVDGGTSRFDKNGIVYQSVCASCWTQWPDPSTSVFPVTDGSKKGNYNCNNACFKYDLSSLNADFTMTKTTSCDTATVVFKNTSTGGIAFEWDLGDGTKIPGSGPITHYYKHPGVYHVKLIATDLTTCIGKDTAEKILTIYPLPALGVNLSDTTICQGDTITILNTCIPTYTYSWTPTTQVLNPTVCNAQFFPSVDRAYYLNVTDENGCKIKDTITIHVATLAKGINWENLTHCDGKPTVRLSNPSTGPLNYFWTFGDGNSSNEASPVHQYSKGGTYPIVLNIYNDYCSATEVGVVKIEDVNIPNLFTPNGDGKNDCFEIKGLYPGWKVEVYNPWNSCVFKADSYANQFCADGLTSSVYYYLVCAPYGDCCKSWVQIISDKK
ncbi:PKD domain-containing protein [Cytophaga aurantiaca]|uniref:DUF7948 domain-containing protein n=1 Tax=Cytophaga aurantiaca TaxID=29530 RepID=UPI001FE241ED|nr:PKD domain-containing protein [Cytophaga aurantiaca]